MDEAEARLSRGKSRPKSETISRARQRVLDSYLNAGEAREEAKGRFRDPALSRQNRKR